MDQRSGKIVASSRILGTELQGFPEKPLGLHVIRAIQINLAEKKRDLGLMGCDSVRKLDGSYVCPAMPVRTADVFSAYHLGDYKHEPY